jgi:hypothetical protein
LLLLLLGSKLLSLLLLMCLNGIAMLSNQMLSNQMLSISMPFRHINSNISSTDSLLPGSSSSSRILSLGGMLLLQKGGIQTTNGVAAEAATVRSRPHPRPLCGLHRRPKTPSSMQATFCCRVTHRTSSWCRESDGTTEALGT